MPSVPDPDHVKPWYLRNITEALALEEASGNVYVRTATIQGATNQGKLWYFQVAQGLIPGTTSVFKAGYNPSIANNTEESLWSNSVIYPWSAWNSGGTLSCVSSGADTGTLTIPKGFSFSGKLISIIGSLFV